jgi:hypothetical protein
VAARPASKDSGWDVFLAQGDGGAVRRGGRIAEDRIEAAAVTPQECGDAFRIGDRVKLDMDRLRWDPAGAHEACDGEAPLATVPSAASPFVLSDEGLALSFDALTSMCLDRRRERIVIGTRGGVLVSPWPRDTRELFTMPVPGRFVARCGDKAMEEVRRVRAMPDGTMWARFGPGREVAVSQDGAEWRPTGGTEPPPVRTQVRGCDVTVTANAVTCGQTAHKWSNDPWPFCSRRPLKGIVDFALSSDGMTLWVCTREHGLFRVLPDHLSGRPPATAKQASR